MNYWIQSPDNVYVAAHRGCRIPTLIEFMEFVKDKDTLTLDVELKEYPTPGGEALVAEAVARGTHLITCNNPDEILEYLRKMGCHK